MKEIKIKIEGVSPLLVNRFLDSQIVDKIKKRTGEQKGIPPKDKLYEVNGKPYLPARYFEACLIEAAKQFKIAGKGKSTYSKYIGATVHIEPEALMLSPNQWEPYTIAAVNPNTRGRMLVTRPRFNEWGTEMTVTCEEDSISTDTIQRIMEYAGRFVGVGDWRPEKKGKFGKFRLVSVKEVKD